MAGPDDNSWWQQDQQAPTGDAFLKTLPPDRASMVQALAEGRQALPAGYSMRSPFGQQLLADVAQYDPSFDAVNLPSRVAARKAFTSGKQGQNITSFNTAIGHLGTLADAAENLNNGNYPFVNGLGNWFDTQTGDPRVTNFNVAKQAVVDELERAFKGTGGNLHEIQQWENTLNSSRSPAQLRGAIKQAADLLQSRIQAQQESYNNAMGTTAQPLPMLSSHATDALKSFDDPNYLQNGYAAPIPAAPGGGPGASGPGAAPPSSSSTPPAPNGGPVAPESLQDTPTGSGQMAIATGDTHSELDPQRAAQIEAAVRSGAPIDQINQLAGTAVDPEQVAAVRRYLQKNPNYHDFVQMLVQKPTSIESRIATNPVGGAVTAALTGAGDAATFGAGSKIGAGAQALGQRLTGDQRSIGDIYNDNLARAEIGNSVLAQNHPIANLAGETAGFIGGDALLGAGAKAALGANRIAAIPGAIRPALGDALYGTAYGVGSSDHLSDIPGNVAKNAALSAAGGILGRGAVKGVSAALSPIANGAVQRLTDAGITLTPGQILGGAAKGIEDRLAGFPIVGDVINNARRGGVEDFNRAAINDALSPIGESVDGVGHEAIKEAQQKVSDAYTNALGNMSAIPDRQFTNDLLDVGKKVQTLSQSHREQFHNIVDTDLQPYLSGKDRLDGNDLQAIKQGLDNRIANLRGDGSSPQDRDLAERLSDVRDAVMNAAGRTDPTSSLAFEAANAAYAKLSRVNGAAAKANEGVFTPNQFRQAVTKRGYGTTTNSLARGDGLMQGLSSDASSILPSRTPDSGTAGRGALVLAAKAASSGVPGAALGGTAGYERGGIAGALTGAALGAAVFSRPGLRATQYILAGSRGKTANTLGDLLRRNAALGGAVGTPLLLSKPSQ